MSTRFALSPPQSAEPIAARVSHRDEVVGSAALDETIVHGALDAQTRPLHLPLSTCPQLEIVQEEP
ncbi:MAG: hypothetical protein U0V87_14845 [Acidobacteriota bacterium]